MKIALLADLHFGVKKSDKTFQESQLRFYKEQLVSELKEEKIDTIIICGDIFDTRQSLNIQTENVVIDLFKEILKDFKIYIIVGNHDIFHTTSTNIHSLKSLDLLENVNVYEKPTEIVIDNKKILLLPWIVDYNKFNELILDKYEYCFAHLDIVGFDMGMKISEEGITIKDIIKKFKHTFTGHYHCRSTKEYIDGETITYIGSPYQITRGDRNQERGYIILDLKTGKFEWKNNTKSMKFYKFIYPNIDKTIITDNVIDIHVPYNLQNEIKKIYDLVKKLELLKPAYPINIFNDSNTEINENLNIETENYNLLKLFEDYLNQIEDTLKNTNITKQELNKCLLELYESHKGSSI